MEKFDQKPVEIVNDLVTDDANKALSAAQGVVLNGKITNHSFGTAVTITTYTSTPYEAPSDGYVNLYHVGGSGDYYACWINGVIAASNCSVANSASLVSGVQKFMTSLFVRKGMTVKVAGNHFSASFIPIE